MWRLRRVDHEDRAAARARRSRRCWREIIGWRRQGGDRRGFLRGMNLGGRWRRRCGGRRVYGRRYDRSRHRRDIKRRGGLRQDRKSVGWGKSVEVGVDRGGG